MTLWMKISEDKYELPEIVCGSVGELSIRTNTKRKKIFNEIYYAEAHNKPCRFARVEADDWTDEEKEEFNEYYAKRFRKVRRINKMRKARKEAIQ